MCDDPEQIEQEDRLWPWLADGSMADACEDEMFDDPFWEDWR